MTSGGGLFPPNALQWVQIPVHSHEKCQETFTGIEITQGMICAGGPGASACNVSIVNKQLTKVLRAKSCNTNIPIPTYIVLLLFMACNKQKEAINKTDDIAIITTKFGELHVILYD